MIFLWRVIKWLDPRQLTKFLLSYLLLYIVVSGISQELDRADSALFLNAAFLGLALGWLIARVPLPAWAASVASGTVGVETALFLAGRMDLPLTDFLKSSWPVFWNFLQGRAVEPETASAWLDAGSRLLQTPLAESIRMKTWLVYLYNGIPSFDPLASALVWGLIFFLVSVFLGWAAGTRQPLLPAVLPGMLCLGLVLVYSRGDWAYAIAALAMILLLVIFGEYDRREFGWIRSGLGFASEIKMDTIVASAVLVPTLLAAAVILPSISLEDISRWIRDRLSAPAESAQAGPESLGLAPGSGFATGEISAGMPRSFLLKGGLELSKEVMLVIVTGEPPIMLPGATLPVPIVHYWRGETYDIYTGRGWSSSPVSVQSFQPGEQVMEVPAGGRILHQKVTASRDGEGPLYSAGELLTVDQAFQVEWRSDEDVFGATVVSPDYQADSVIPTAGESELRAAGIEYPDRIRNRYLTLPLFFPERIRALAVSITASAVTPYDQALAIQNYLRREYKYSLDIHAAPPRRDVMDYFLFDSREGYCDYFASAMVVLARAAGIPARLASGYAPGTYNLSQLQFVVTEADAHSWPELYFPGIGWVEFEPTPAMETIRRANTAPPSVAENLLGGVSTETKSLSGVVETAFHFLAGVPLAVLVCVAAFAVWILLAPLRFLFLPPAVSLRARYRGLRAHGRRLGIPATRATTPMEFGLRLEDFCQPKLKDPQLRLIRRVASDYTRMIFGNHPPAAAEQREQFRDWVRLDRGLWGLWLWMSLRVFLHPRRQSSRLDSPNR